MSGELLCKTIDYYTEASGILPLLYSIRDCVPSAFPTLLFVIFFILFAGYYFIIKNKTGRAKFLIAIASSSFITLILSMFLLLSMLITYRMMLLWVFLTVLSFIGIVLSDKQ